MAKVWKFLMKTSMKEFLSCKVTNLQCSDCNFAITDTFWNMYRKLAVIKKNVLRKKVYGGPAS